MVKILTQHYTNTRTQDILLPSENGGVIHASKAKSIYTWSERLQHLPGTIRILEYTRAKVPFDMLFSLLNKIEKIFNCRFYLRVQLM